MFSNNFGKRVIGLLLAGVFLHLTAGCTQAEKEAIVLPPARNVPYPGLVDYADVNFEAVYAQAEAIARIKVGNWLGEDTGDNNHTFFEAAVLECYTGSMPETFTLIQTGSSHGKDGRPIFTYGNEMLLFLVKAPAEYTSYEDAYYNEGSFFSVFDVSYDNDGERYFVVRNGWFGKSLPFATPLKEIPMKEITEYAVKNDPILEETGFAFSYAFTEKDLKKLIDSD